MKENGDTCLRYLPHCNLVADSDNIGSVEDVKDACTEEKVLGSKRGEDRCWTACSPAACCFPRIYGYPPEGGCEGEVRWCEKYEDCQMLSELEIEDDVLRDDHFES